MNADNNSAPQRGETISPASGTQRIFWSTLLLAAGLAIFLSAGFWQLDRAEEKRAFINSFNDATQTPVLTAPVDPDIAETLLYRRFRLRGRYLPGQQILLDNMVSGGEVGYQVITPFRLEPDADSAARDTDGKLLLVNRGWIKGNADRTQLPAVDVAGNIREVRGRLAFLPAPGIRLQAPLPDPASAKWPLPMTWPTTAEVSALLDEPVLEWQLLLDADVAEGYRREWHPDIMRPETHLGYALQWFSFAALAVIIYLLLNLRAARKLRAARAQTKPSNTSSTL